MKEGDRMLYCPIMRKWYDDVEPEEHECIGCDGEAECFVLDEDNSN